MIVYICISVLFFLEAWLEVVVIKLKDGDHPEYKELNKQEHFRSAMLFGWIMGCALMLSIFVFHHFWVIPPILMSRRLFFDWPLIIMRDRPRNLYEGNDWWAGLLSRIFGIEGRKIELWVEIAITIVCLALHVITSNLTNKCIW